jgi:hypothetical protein
MRTTLSLESDVDQMLREMMIERGITMKEAVNAAIRAGIRPVSKTNKRFRTPTFSLGVPIVPLEKSLQIAAELEDDELIRKMNLGK